MPYHTSPPVLAQDTESRPLTALLGWNNRKVIFHLRAAMSLVNNGALQNPPKKTRTAAKQTRNGSIKTEARLYNHFSEELNL